MEDLTIFEGVFDHLMQQIEAGENEEEILNYLNKSILEARLKTSKNPSYFVMTINMNSSVSVRGDAQKRRDLLSIILRSGFPTALIFCQELPGKFETEVVPDPKKYDYRRTKNETAVVWNKSRFAGSSKGLGAANTDIKKLGKESFGTRKNASQLLSRISMVKLKPLRAEHDESILAVSFHGRYRGKTKEERIKTFNILVKFLNKVIKLRGINSYIIGGDFNFDTQEVEPPKNVVVPNFELSPRSQEKKQKSGRFIPNKDNFICYPHKAVIITWSRALVFCDENDKSSDLTEEEHETVNKSLTSETTKTTNATASGATGTTEASEATKETKATDLLDHDPVVGVLVFLPPPKEVRQDLSKTFEKMSMSDSQKGADAAYPGTK